MVIISMEEDYHGKRIAMKLLYHIWCEIIWAIFSEDLYGKNRCGSRELPRKIRNRERASEEFKTCIAREIRQSYSNHLKVSLSRQKL